MADQLEQGWGWPGASRKAHYFLLDDPTSICGRWMFTGPRSDDHHASPDNCVACQRKREKL